MAECEVCQRVIVDTAYVCADCADRLGERLSTAAALAPELTAVVARQARYADPGPSLRGMAPAAPIRPDGQARHYGDQQDGWPGGLVVDLAASETRDAVANTVGTWCRLVVEERGGSYPGQLGQALRWLVGQLGWLRYQRYAAEAWDELEYATRMVERAVDRPVQRVDAGLCLAATEVGPCQQRLSAAPAAAYVHCPACRTTHSALERRETILQAARGIRGSAEEVAAWLTILGVPVRANTVRQWRKRGRVLPDGAGRYRLGDVEELAGPSLARAGA